MGCRVEDVDGEGEGGDSNARKRKINESGTAVIKRDEGREA